MRLSAKQSEALVRALHSMEGAAARWAENPKLDDASLTARIAYEFGTMGGYCGEGVWLDYRGGANPRVEIKAAGEEPIQLSGRELLAATREVLGTTRPGELF
jgi:hypothetical protein